jgi:hypothetical protein
MQLQGFFGDLEVLILIDSGSNHASKFARCIPLLQPMSVKIVDGGTIHYEFELPNAKWIMQAIPFSLLLRFPLLVHLI